MRGLVVETSPRGCAEAITWYDQAIKADPDTNYYAAKAFCLGELGRFKEAVAVADTALQQQPGSTHALSHKAYSLYHLGDKQSAERLSALVVQTEPTYALGHFDRARLLAAEGSMDQALAELTSAAGRDFGRVRPLDIKAPEFAAVKNRPEFLRALTPPP